jgi:hypothetical protein
MQGGEAEQTARHSPRAGYGRIASGAGAALAVLIALGAMTTDNAVAQAPAGAAPAAPAAPNELPVTQLGANLNISPKRVTFDRADRSSTIYVFNQGGSTATFDVQLTDRVMLPDGQLVPVTEAEAKPDQKAVADRVKSARDMLVIAPRRATLAPGKGQTIRIRVNPNGGAAAGSTVQNGEYRSHLTVTSIPPPDIGLTAEQAARANPTELSFRINSVFGISIPVIVRVGPLDLRAAIENAKLTTMTISPDGVQAPRPSSVLRMDLVRQGTTSLFGNLEVHGSKDKPTDILGLVRGIGVYPEIDRRVLQIVLRRAPMPGEQLEVTFKDDDTAPGRLVAKTTLTNP